MARLLAAVLMAAALLMLLIACANAANLLLALATQRRQEALIKTALGASRLRLVREFLRETVVLCSFGGVLGYAMALAPLAWLSRFDAPLPVIGAVQIAADLHPGTLVAALTLALIVLASAVSGLAPALYASKPNLASALSGEMAIGGTRRGMLRNAVVVVQVAICTLVLVGTGLCLRGLHNLRQVDPGFSAKKIVMIFPDIEGLPEGTRVQAPGPTAPSRPGNRRGRIGFARSQPAARRNGRKRLCPRGNSLYRSRRERAENVRLLHGCPTKIISRRWVSGCWQAARSVPPMWKEVPKWSSSITRWRSSCGLIKTRSGGRPGSPMETGSLLSWV